MKKKKDKKTKKQEDSAWKDILEKYFPEFLQFFFPQIYKDINFSYKPEFLDKEFQKILKRNEIGKRFSDKLVKIYLKSGKEKWLLVHIEVQGEPESNFEERIYIYNYRIFDKYRKDVVSLVILTDDNKNFKPNKYEKKRWGFELTLKFPSIKILDYKDKIQELEKNTNPFAIVVIACIKVLEFKNNYKELYKFKLSITKELYRKKYSKEDIINLFRFIDWLITLPEDLETKFDNEILKLEEEKSMAYITSIEKSGYRRGMAEGIEKGVKKGVKKGGSKGKN